MKVTKKYINQGINDIDSGLGDMRKCYRSKWIDGTFIALCEFYHQIQSERFGIFTPKPCVAVFRPDGSVIYGWTPSKDDIEATDWVIEEVAETPDETMPEMQVQAPDEPTPTSRTKTWRKDLDVVLQEINEELCECTDAPQWHRYSEERLIAVTKITEAIMWLGMDLKAIHSEPNPYPDSYNPASPNIAPTADGLKM